MPEMSLGEAKAVFLLWESLNLVSPLKNEVGQVSPHLFFLLTSIRNEARENWRQFPK